MRRPATLLAVVALLVATAGGVAQEPDRAYAAEACDGVWVVVDARAAGGALTTRCAPGDPASGIQALTGAGHGIAYLPGHPGFVCTIDSRPDPCNGAPTDAYWSYWYAPAGGSWSYGTTGAGSRDPAPGTVEGWRFGDGSTPPGTAPPAPPAPPPPPADPQPAPPPEPAPEPAPAPAPEPAPAPDPPAPAPSGDPGRSTASGAGSGTDTSGAGPQGPDGASREEGDTGMDSDPPAEDPTGHDDPTTASDERGRLRTGDTDGPRSEGPRTDDRTADGTGDRTGDRTGTEAGTGPATVTGDEPGGERDPDPVDAGFDALAAGRSRTEPSRAGTTMVVTALLLAAIGGLTWYQRRRSVD